VAILAIRIGGTTVKPGISTAINFGDPSVKRQNNSYRWPEVKSAEIAPMRTEAENLDGSHIQPRLGRTNGASTVFQAGHATPN
jgi:hypothetical protein